MTRFLTYIVFILFFIILYTVPARAAQVGLLPFENISGRLGLSEQVMPIIKEILRKKGYRVISGDAVEQVLYKDMIRRTGGISARSARALKEKLGVDYVMVGTFYLFAFVKDNPQFGLSARLISATDDKILWAEATGASGADYTSILDFGTLRTFEELWPRVVNNLFDTLPRDGEGFDDIKRAPPGGFFSIFGRGHINYYLSKYFKKSPPKRVAVLPFENQTERMGAARIVTDIMVAELFNSGLFEVVELGEVEEKVIQEDVWVYGGLDNLGVRSLRGPLNAEALVIGSVENYDEGLKKYSTTPEINLFVRMLSTVPEHESQILWIGQSERSGKDSVIVMEFGIVRSMSVLTKKTIGDMIKTLQ